MEKVVRALFLTLMVLAATGVANADWTTTVYNTAVSSEVVLGQTFSWPPSGQTTQWDHMWAVPSDPDFTDVSLIDADLIIQSQYTTDKTEEIRLDSLANPSLGDLQNGATSFDVLSYAGVLDGNVTVYAKLLVHPVVGRTILDKSTLNLEYQITKRVWEDNGTPGIPAVPAPAAIVLSGLGAGLVGWIRRRGLV